MKKFSKFVVAIVLAFTLVGVCFAFTGCIDPKEPESVYEIKLYDDNWVELKKDYGNHVVHYEDYVVQYDGTPKLCNAIVYKNGEEFYKLDYKKNSKFNEDYVLTVTQRLKKYNSGKYVMESKDMPIEKDEYVLTYEYNIYGDNDKKNPFFLNSLPSQYHHDKVVINLIIS